MTAHIRHHEFNATQKDLLKQLITVTTKETKFQQSQTFQCIQQDESDTTVYYIPFATYKQITNKFPNEHKTFPTSTKGEFNGSLSKLQEEVLPLSMNKLQNERSLLLSLFTGAGKTVLTLHILNLLRLRSIILCNRVTLIQQWYHSVKKFLPHMKAQILEGKSTMNEDTDVFIVNLCNVRKRSRAAYENIGILVIDECPCICSPSAMLNIYQFQPKYVIGLSATPTRSDGMSQILNMMLGCENTITRKLDRHFDVYTLNTKLKYPANVLKKSSAGALDWNAILKFQCEHTARNQLIIDLVKYFDTRNILVLCKRVDQATNIWGKLFHDGVDTELYVNNSRHYDANCRVLVSSFSKSGIGNSNKYVRLIVWIYKVCFAVY